MPFTKSTTKEGSPSALKQSVQFLKGVGPKRKEILVKLGIHTILDLLCYFPRDYKDYTQIQKISDVRLGETITIRGEVVGIKSRMGRSRMHILEVFVDDGTGSIAATWFNQSFLAGKFRVGDMMFCHGKVGAYKYPQLLSPEYEVVHDDTTPLGRWGIIPVYPLTEHISQGYLRKIIGEAVQKYAGSFEEVLPEELLENNGWMPIQSAMKNIHFPETFGSLNDAKSRLIYEELFILELAMALRRRCIKEDNGISFKIGSQVDGHIRKRIPFSLTAAQERVIREIKEDMRSYKPMHRLLQGDVGSGKTIVAVYAILAAVANGYQAAFMAPTEILATQHFTTIQKYLCHSELQVRLLKGETPSGEKKECLERISRGEIDLVIGTHTLIETGVRFEKLGLVVIDEQHKFGVVQRLKLKKKGLYPDMLVMTATPIPRTLSLTVFGDMDISVLDEMPPGRSVPKTFWIPKSREKDTYAFIDREISKGRQAFIVYPLVEESEMLDLKSAVQEAKRLQEGCFSNRRVGLLHGQMKSVEKERVMKHFRERRYDILVSTVVIEVGIDIPNATVMVIEHAERFGLAQLHQLRGRIGRGSEHSYCLLFGNPKSDISCERLKIMTHTGDGFRIAEMDFRLRGPGEFFGTRQHGLPELRISNLIRDYPLLKQARKDAFRVVVKDPQLRMETHVKIRQRVLETFKDRLELVNIG
ncbi:MAG: ATP-dependent DNA helicase RecG [Candidatus Brocadiaceae bacterium]|nr:ATP-dependent DNA helicase RecG [Candidatus Brocadiaceae bacterium]